MSEQTASSGLPASPRTLELLPRVVPARRSPDHLFAFARLAIDLASLTFVALVARSAEAHPLNPPVVLLIGAVTIAGYAAAGLYLPRSRSEPVTEIRHLLSILAVVTMTVTAIELAFGREGVGDEAVRLWLLASTLTAAGRLTLMGAEQVVRRNATRGHGATLIVGAGRVGHLAARRLLEDPSLGMRPIGFLDKEPLAPQVDDPASPDLPVLGASWDLEQVVAAHEVEHVLVAFSTAPNSVVLDMVRRCWRLGVSVMVVPRLYEVEGLRTRTEHLGALPLVTLSPSDPRGRQFQVKYAFDRLVAALALIAASPLLGLITLGLLITSGRPIFFRQRRVGRDGHVFEMLKFRTMSGRPEQSGEFDAQWAAMAIGEIEAGEHSADVNLVTGDRRTPMGHLLRRTSLDELPQLWNVLRGDMSLIGPRPERLHYVELFEQSIHRYPDRHRVKSGLTGWAQVNGLRGDTSLADRIEWDNFYIENWSPWLDLKILVKTIPALLAGRGAR
jgi:exopolysaccharide biosynthesis polyprenyl glycosylphosphotransferase